MEEFELISFEALQRTAGTREQRFLNLVATADDELQNRLAGATAGLIHDLRTIYIAQVRAAADELGVGELPASSTVHDNDWVKFQAALAGLKTRLLLRVQLEAASDGVGVSNSTKAGLEREVDRLQEIVDAADIEDAMRKRITRKLLEIRRELAHKRFDLSKFAVVAATVATLTTSTFADVPDASQTIFKILEMVGIEVERSEEQRLIEGPRKALPAPSADDLSSEETA